MGENIETREKKPKYLSKMISGFFSGLGFAIAIVIIVLLAGFILDYFEEEEKEAMEKEKFVSSLENRVSSPFDFDENSGLIIANHKSQRDENKLILLGQIKNNGNETWSNIHIEVDLFDSEKVFIDQCSDLIWGDIKPQQTRNFKIKCGEWADQLLGDFETYEINIVHATQER